MRFFESTCNDSFCQEGGSTWMYDAFTAVLFETIYGSVAYLLNSTHRIHQLFPPLKRPHIFQHRGGDIAQRLAG